LLDLDLDLIVVALGSSIVVEVVHSQTIVHYRVNKKPCQY
jgi:hypothetical protein